MSRLQVGGLALILNSLSGKLTGKVAILKSHRGIRKSSKTGVVADTWEITVDNRDWLTRSDWLIPLGDEQTQEELRKESIEQKKQQEHSERV